ncbi:MAG: thioesterase family protein [Desulfobacterales bacterium]|nr:thioesterase family protein [Desulfobacterales bacterium]
MKDSLKPGLTFDFKYTVPEDKTVPFLYPDIPEGREMPKVFATGFLVGLCEFACIRFINPHINWPEEQTVGVSININHSAATPPGFTVTVKGKLEKVEGRKLTFSLEAEDGVNKISSGTHERFIIDAKKFNAQVEAKATKA